ncbi:unnamed protein product [Rotaria sp. Silwood1]|nr:unnamed protein product [Rotaria sp. Silwood1]CAF4862326.1 unnamed protein product [Rotaria sp. Silwood1]
MNTTLTTLNLQGNRIDAQGAQYLANILQNNTTLTTLILSDNNIGGEGVQHLANVLESNRTLTKLELECAEIGNIGAQYLAEVLKKNTTLNMLKLAQNVIEAEGAGYLANALHINTTLTSLCLRNNRIYAEGNHLLRIEYSIHNEHICEHKCSINHLCSMATYNRQYHRCHLFQYHNKHSISHPYRLNNVYSTFADCSGIFSLSHTTQKRISIVHCDYDSLPWQRALRSRSIIFQSYTLIGISYLPCQELCSSVRHCAAVQYQYIKINLKKQARGLYRNRCRLLRSAKPWDLLPSKSWTVFVKRSCHVKISHNELFYRHHQPLCNFKYVGQGQHKHNQGMIHTFRHISEIQCQYLCSKIINCVGIEFVEKQSQCILLSSNFLRNDGSIDIKNHKHHHIYMKISCSTTKYIQSEQSLSKCSINNQYCNCHQNPCHHGICLLSQQREGYHYMFCNCYHGYTGHLCDQHLDNKCPCLNGGQCLNDYSSCICSNGYDGDFCQIISDKR